MKKKILIGLCLDRAASLFETYDEQVEKVKSELSRLFGKLSPSFYEATYPAEGEHGLRPGTDIVAYDYGGMLPGCGDLLRSNARSIITWADEHPSGVVLIVSSFTWNTQIKWEIEDSGLTLPNILEFGSYNEEFLPDWLRGMTVEEHPKLASHPLRPVFFRPSKTFIRWLTNRAAGDPVVDAGCGTGHTLKLLQDAGAKAIGVDINAEPDPDTSKPFPIDATRFGYLNRCIVLIARPCHSDWVQKAMAKSEAKAKEILYVGLKKNYDSDLGEYAEDFREIGFGAGKDEEFVWSYKPKEIG